ncbi:1,3-beta-glucanosyltransferase gas1 [Mortierella sp. AD094]|nr:1,3-beta-glucanosyltransferase gas1 [Mortierella sp. AD094]
MPRIIVVRVLAAVAASSISSVAALNPIVIKGTKFFDSATKDQFFINGVAYQPRTLASGFVDPLSRPDDCRRDFALMKDLGINTIRVYQIDSSLNHDECMRLLEDVGMYLVLDLAVPRHSIIRDSPEYNTDIWNNVRNTVDAFKDYSNTLGFFIGNEVTNDKKTTAASAYVKALLRDTKRHLSAVAPRKIPIGYANNDDPSIRLQIQDYFNCGSEEERIDFYGINLYDWCGSEATYENSGYADRTKDIATYSIPVFLSKYGCNLVSPRTFNETKSIFGPDMTEAWSGGIVYEWSEEENKYGLVKIQPDNTVTLMPDYNNIKAALSPLHPTGVKMDDFNEERPISTCPANTPTWEASSILPPTPFSLVCDCMLSSLSCIASESALENPDNIGVEINTLCGMTSCDDIATNGKTGVYGKYSFCTPAQKLSYMYNYHYINTGNKDPSSCNYNGMGKLTVAAQSSDESCSLIKDSAVEISTYRSVASTRFDSSKFGPGLLATLTVVLLKR